MRTSVPQRVPCGGVPEQVRLEKRLPRTILSIQEVRRILAVAREKTPIGLRDRAILETFYSLSKIHGTRIVLELLSRFLSGKGFSDVRRVREEDLVSFCAHLRKHESWRLRVPISLSTQRYYMGTVRAFFAFLEARILRHTCATHLLQGGADVRHVQKLLGHEEIDTTAIYTRVAVKDLREVIERRHPRR